MSIFSQSPRLQGKLWDDSAFMGLLEPYQSHLGLSAPANHRGVRGTLGTIHHGEDSETEDTFATE